MREYQDEKCQVLKYIICNGCGKRIPVKQGMPSEEVFCAEQTWGYFSHRDGEVHRFDLCEACYEQMTKQFVVPVEKMELTEYV